MGLSRAARWPDLLGATLHAATALDQLAEVHRDRPVAGGGKQFTQPAGARRDEDMQSVADRVESEGVCVEFGRNKSIWEQLAQQSAALLTECSRVIGNVITLVVQNGQSKIEVEEPRIHQLEAEHFTTSQRGELVMSRATLSGIHSQRGFFPTARRNRPRPR